MSKILRRVLYVFLSMSLFWAFFWWQTHPLLAVVGGVSLVFGFVPVLGVQFLTLWWGNRADPSPRATPNQLALAWWEEIKLTVKVFVVDQAYREHRFSDTFTQKTLLVRQDKDLAQQGKTAPVMGDLSSITKKQRGVVFIHGFLCNRGFWNPWLQRLQEEGIPFVAISLEPVFSSIDNYTPMVERAVRDIAAQHGVAPLLICHSMGGLAARAWLRANPGSESRVSHIVTIGTPHHGTMLVRRPGFAVNATQMQKNSAWVQKLAADEMAHPNAQSESAYQNPSAKPVQSNPYAHFTCYYSNCDNIVFPPLTATLEGADNRFVPGQAHVEMAFDETVMRESLARL